MLTLPKTPKYLPRSIYVLISCLLLAPLQLASGLNSSAAIAVAQRASKSEINLVRYVNPFIGTGGHGHTFPGASVPFGMVQLSPDTRLTGWDGCSGYHYYDNAIYGFSHTHLSGTGISDYGDILFMPTFVDAKTPSSFSHDNEKATAGYYSVRLENNIFVELTATARSGFHRYSFPSNSATGIVRLDLQHRDHVIDSYLHVINNTHIEGFRRSSAWAKNQVVFFVAEFSKPFTKADASQALNEKGESHGTDIKATFSFDHPETLLLKVGISAVSIEGARKNLETEIPDWNFERVRQQASDDWNSELNKIQVTGGDQSQLQTFYTALYHTKLAPNLYMDVDGNYLGRDFKIHKATGFDNYTVFSLWDTFRAAHPLYTIIDQKRTVDFINTFLAQYEQGGRLPVWELSANETDTMIGYHAVSVIADAVVKGISGFDRELAFKAMKHSAELKHFGLDSYTNHGYVDMAAERESVSRTLEYAYDDWCIAQVALALGQRDDYSRYMKRAQSYKNIFDRGTGFVRPRSNGGWFSPFEPREVNFNFTEANSWQYSFFVPQDISGLTKLMGGQNQFAAKLDALFSARTETTGRDQADITGLIGQYAHGNEPSHHVAYLYDYVGQAWKTQYRVRQVMDEFYRPEPDGLIGNEDCGQMSAWYVLSAAGFYPVTPGSTIYAIGTPLFPELRFNLENGKSFVVRASAVSVRNFYIQSATLNGRPYNKSFLRHEDIIAGGELDFTMGSSPNKTWSVNELPTSRISGEQLVPVPIIKAASSTFNDSLEIELEPNDATNTIHFTLDGNKPSRSSPVYNRALLIEKSLTVKAIAIGAKNSTSDVAVASFRKMPHQWMLRLLSKYSSQYTGGGDQALIDGVRGTKNFSGGTWQGYQGHDLIAVIDLGETKSVSKLGAGFLQDVGSWIFMPTQVDFEVSSDGQNFEPVLSIVNDVPVQSYETVIKDFVKTIEPRSARYVKIRAQNFGKLPSWHVSAGGDAWIFADEIIIE